jgi:hypothetical protein
MDGDGAAAADGIVVPDDASHETAAAAAARGASASTRQSITLMTLPDDVLLHICHLLPRLGQSGDLILTMPAVCNRLRTLCRDHVVVPTVVRPDNPRVAYDAKGRTLRRGVLQGHRDLVVRRLHDGGGGGTGHTKGEESLLSLYPGSHAPRIRSLLYVKVKVLMTSI